MNIETNKYSSEVTIITPPNATPFTIADAVIRKCGTLDVIEDVMYYIECYVNRARRNTACDTTADEIF